MKFYWNVDWSDWDLTPSIRVGRDAGDFCGDKSVWYLALALGPAQFTIEK